MMRDASATASLPTTAATTVATTAATSRPGAPPPTSGAPAAATAALSPRFVSLSRRAALAAALASAFATAVAPPRPASASAPPQQPPLAALPATSPFASFVQPGPVPFPRRTLDLRFAVLLMRACYDGVDGADALQMRDFQVLFWKRREAEVEAYSQLISPLAARKGDLSDPLYFDFISYSQLLAADAAVRGHPPRVFEEEYDECELRPDQDECPILTRVVRRELPLSDDDLPSEVWRRSGDGIYAALRDGFRGETFAGVPPPPAAGATPAEVAAGFRALLAVFVGRGYALSADVTEAGGGGEDGGGAAAAAAGGLSLRVSVQGAATQWGAAALASRRSKLLTLHEAMALDAWLRAGGAWRASAVEAEFSDASRATTWRILRA